MCYKVGLKIQAIALAFLLGLFGTSHLYASPNPDDLIGQWRVDRVGEDGIMEVYKEGDHYYGRLIWGTKLYDEAGNTKYDENNPDPSLHSRPLEGLVFLTDFVFDGKKKWDDGQVYDFTSGKTYPAYIQLRDHDTLIMRGYIGISLLGRSVTWYRIDS